MGFFSSLLSTKSARELYDEYLRYSFDDLKLKLFNEEIVHHNGAMNRRSLAIILAMNEKKSAEDVVNAFKENSSKFPELGWMMREKRDIIEAIRELIRQQSEYDSWKKDGMGIILSSFKVDLAMLDL